MVHRLSGRFWIRSGVDSNINLSTQLIVIRWGPGHGVESPVHGVSVMEGNCDFQTLTGNHVWTGLPSPLRIEHLGTIVKTLHTDCVPR